MSSCPNHHGKQASNHTSPITCSQHDWSPKSLPDEHETVPSGYQLGFILVSPEGSYGRQSMSDSQLSQLCSHRIPINSVPISMSPDAVYYDTCRSHSPYTLSVVRDSVSGSIKQLC